MPMQLNPIRASKTLGDPSSMQGGINSLLQMQGNTTENLIDTLGNVGKINRTNTVNDLIARGGLEGLNELQAQQRILQEAGGSLTDTGQANVDALLKGTGALDQRDFQEAQQLQRQEEARGVADLLDKRSIQKAQTLQENKKLNIEQKDKLARANVFKTITGADGMEYGVRKGGTLVPLTDVLTTMKGSGSGSSGKYKPTGNIKAVYNDSGAESKEVIEFFDNPMYNLQFKASTYTDDKGKVHKNKGEGQFFFNGKKVTLPELKDIKRITEENLKRG